MSTGRVATTVAAWLVLSCCQAIPSTRTKVAEDTNVSVREPRAGEWVVFPALLVKDFLDPDNRNAQCLDDARDNDAQNDTRSVETMECVLPGPHSSPTLRAEVWRGGTDDNPQKTKQPKAHIVPLGAALEAGNSVALFVPATEFPLPGPLVGFPAKLPIGIYGWSGDDHPGRTSTHRDVPPDLWSSFIKFIFAPIRNALVRTQEAVEGGLRDVDWSAMNELYGTLMALISKHRAREDLTSIPPMRVGSLWQRFKLEGDGTRDHFLGTAVSIGSRSNTNVECRVNVLTTRDVFRRTNNSTVVGNNPAEISPVLYVASLFEPVPLDNNDLIDDINSARVFKVRNITRSSHSDKNLYVDAGERAHAIQAHRQDAKRAKASVNSLEYVAEDIDSKLIPITVENELLTYGFIDRTFRLQGPMENITDSWLMAKCVNGQRNWICFAGREETHGDPGSLSYAWMKDDRLGVGPTIDPDPIGSKKGPIVRPHGQPVPSEDPLKAADDWVILEVGRWGKCKGDWGPDPYIHKVDRELRDNTRIVSFGYKHLDLDERYVPIEGETKAAPARATVDGRSTGFVEIKDFKPDAKTRPWLGAATFVRAENSKTLTFLGLLSSSNDKDVDVVVPWWEVEPLGD